MKLLFRSSINLFVRLFIAGLFSANIASADVVASTAIPLLENGYDSTNRGWRWSGAVNDYPDRIIFGFSGVRADAELRLKAFDTDSADETCVYLNDSPLGCLPSGHNNQLTPEQAFRLPAALQTASSNLLEVRQKKSRLKWGITAIGLFTGAQQPLIPSISGTSATQANVGTAYSFAPTTTNAGANPVFSIQNQPAWASFDTNTGALTGTPTSADVGTTTGIVISVDDGNGGSASLPAFSLEVINAGPGADGFIALLENAYDSTNRGWRWFGAVNDYPDGIVFGFSGVRADAEVRLKAFDTDSADETCVYLNNSPLGCLPSGYNNQLTPEQAFRLPAALQTASSNQLEVRQKKPRLKWGITAIGLFTGAQQPVTPSISGAPATQVTMGTAYSFAPTTTNAGANPVFSIQNQPAWASFDPNTGTLTGTPASADVGTTTGIVISVDDGNGASASLSAFNLEVMPAINVAFQYGLASQGSTYGANPASYANDGDPTTFNHTKCNASDNWWQIQLPVPTQISHIVLTARAGWASRIENTEIYVSDTPYDGTLDTDKKVFTSARTSSAQEILLTPAHSATYVIVKAAGDNCLHMQELEVYGAPPAAPKLSQSSYAFGLEPHTETDTVIGRVTAMDYQNDSLTYSIPENLPFSIDNSGNIKVTALVNHNMTQHYSFTVNVSDGSNTDSAPVNIYFLNGRGIDLQRWEGVAGTAISDLTGSAHYQNDPPDYESIVSSLDATSVGNNYGQRLTGILKPEISGDYVFAIVGDDATTLKLSTTADPSSAQTIAQLDSWSNYQNWGAAAKSASIHLEAGGVYYIEALHKEGSGGDHVSVGWKLADAADFVPVPAEQLFLETLTLEKSKPYFATHETSFLTPHSTTIGARLLTLNGVDLQGDNLTYAVVGNAPFSVDTDGKVTINNTLQAGMLYEFNVTVSDGTHTATTSLSVHSTSAAAVEDALSSGVVENVTAEELLDAAITELSVKKSIPSLLSDLYGNDPISYTPGNRTQLITIDPWAENALPILIGNQGRTLGMAGATNTSRYAAFGMSPTELFQNGASLDYVTPFNRLLAWLLGGAPIDITALDGNLIIALSFANSDRGNIKNWIASAHPNWTVSECNTVAELGACYASADLVITGWQGDNADAQTIRQALATVMDTGKPVLYVHTWYEAYNGVAHAIADLLNFSLPYGGNFWADDAASWNDVEAMQAGIWNQQGLGGIETMLNHFKAEDYDFDWSACDGENCSAVAGLDREFQQGASKVRSIMTNLDSDKINLFALDGLRLQKLLALLGDKYRQSVQFPMDKNTTDDNIFLKSYFADHAVYNYRSINPAQPDMGNFSRSDFSHITPVAKLVERTSKVNFRSASVYALPGQTVRVTRLDTSDLTVKIHVNTLRSGSTHEWTDNGYKRPKYLKSPSMPISSGETIEFTSPYGGPLQIAFGANDLPVQLHFENVGEHPYWASSADDDRFTEKLDAGEYDWAELVTPGFEVHSRLDKMRDSINEWGSAQALAAATMRYMHNYPHVLAGFQGPGIDIVPEIHNFAADKGWTINQIDLVKHMNADQATCGYGCSGNPYDAYWSFSPIGHGDVHELGHGLERGRFRFMGWEGHSQTNPYSYYTKSRFHETTGGDPDCQNLPFDTAFTALQGSVGQADPLAYMNNNYWSASNWSHQVLMTIQTMMTTQKAGKLENGWHLLARLHIHDREFRRADDSQSEWEAKRASLGFNAYEFSEVSSIDNNDYMLIAWSTVAELDFRDYLNMWGISYSQKAADQVASFTFPTAPREFFISSPNGYCRSTHNGDFLAKTTLPVNGDEVWPAETDSDGDGH